MRSYFPILLIMCSIIAISGCKKDWHESTDALTGRYNLYLTAHNIDPASGLDSVYTYFDTVEIIAGPPCSFNNGGMSINIQRSPASSWNYCHVSNNGDTVVYLRSQSHITQQYSFWAGGDSVSYEYYAIPNYNPRSISGGGVKTH